MQHDAIIVANTYHTHTSATTNLHLLCVSLVVLLPRVSPTKLSALCETHVVQIVSSAASVV